MSNMLQRLARELLYCCVAQRCCRFAPALGTYKLYVQWRMETGLVLPCTIPLGGFLPWGGQFLSVFPPSLYGALFFWELWAWEPSPSPPAPMLSAGRPVQALSPQGIAQPPASFFHSASSAER